MIADRVIDDIPVHIINIIRYMWEIDFEMKEVRFLLDIADIANQRIIVYIGDTAVDTKVILLDNPIVAAIQIRRHIDDFIMDLHE